VSWTNLWLNNGVWTRVMLCVESIYKTHTHTHTHTHTEYETKVEGTVEVFHCPSWPLNIHNGTSEARRRWCGDFMAVILELVWADTLLKYRELSAQDFRRIRAGFWLRTVYYGRLHSYMHIGNTTTRANLYYCCCCCCCCRISHFSALAGKYSPILGFSNQQD
jgi:hypothetical protein